MINAIYGKKIGMTQLFDEGRQRHSGHRYPGRAEQGVPGEDT